ncbi:hypothetical protein N7456_008700 [Penicillium angulare]|uniref:BZIP domain-containing protein n=1 Tax=Penicillium angulare TaxID=116970 RepID=A0A9W9F3H1_9EURO|nr:hypothetical protein N7456_008700 [Penicillium angulare]
MRLQQSNEHNNPIQSTENEEIEKRRLRNRLSQQAFRRRQKESLRELRNQAQSKDKPENEIIHELREENNKLRKELLDVQSKLSRYISSMESLTGSISSALQGTSNEKVESEAELEIESSNSPQEQSSLPAQAGISELDLDALNDMNVFSFGNSQNLLNDTMTTGNPTPLIFVKMRLTWYKDMERAPMKTLPISKRAS